MTLKEYIKMVRQDIKKSSALAKEIDNTYFFRICAVFVLNVIGIIGFVIMKNDFPLPIFCAIWGISALIIIEILWHIFSDNITKNMPDLFVEEYEKRGTPTHKFKCWLIFVGNLHFRGYKCNIYVYKDAIIIKFIKKCLLIDNFQQIKLNEVIFGYRCEFSKGKQYIQCNVDKKQAQILQQWADENSK